MQPNYGWTLAIMRGTIDGLPWWLNWAKPVLIKRLARLHSDGDYTVGTLLHNWKRL